MTAKMEHYLLGLLWPLKQLVDAPGPLDRESVRSAVDTLAKEMQAALRDRKVCPACGMEFTLGYDPRFCSFKCYETYRRKGGAR